VVDRREVDLVAEPLELAHKRHEEAPEIGIFRPGPHLGYEQDAHAAGSSRPGARRVALVGP
jgi:hypothetical protein